MDGQPNSGKPSEQDAYQSPGRVMEPSPPHPGPAAGVPLRPNRANLILFLGIVSLLPTCGLFGIAAWLLGNSDLRRIRNRGASPVGIGTVKLGRALGIVGTVLIVVYATAVGVLFQRHAAGWEAAFRREPLRIEHVVFAGEWYGDKGTFLRIQLDGAADYRTQNSTVTGGQVRITEDSLSIGFFGWYKTWRVDAPPHQKNGNWIMKLDNETFIRNWSENLV